VGKIEKERESGLQGQGDGDGDGMETKLALLNESAKVVFRAATK